jgi:hypothetical protein
MEMDGPAWRKNCQIRRSAVSGSPTGFCIFCEDIRQEINGKQSYIGVFGGSELKVLGALPASIGKFSINAIFRQRVTDGIEPITLEVHLPGDDDDKPSARIDAAIEDIAAQLPPPAADVDDPFLQVAIGFQFNPLAIAQEGRITVSAVKAGKRYRIGSLRVISEPPPEMKEAANWGGLLPAFYAVSQKIKALLDGSRATLENVSYRTSRSSGFFQFQ